MATYRGFVQSIEVRGDGWVEFVVQAVHAGNTRRTFYIQDLDGNINMAHRRLGQMSLLRDALARILPVEVEYQAANELGNVVEDLTIYPRPSIAGRSGTRRLEGTVIGLAITERGPLSDSSPYFDAADLAGVVLLTTGGLENVLLDLQRPDPLTAQAMLGLLREAFRTRRPVAVLVGDESAGEQKEREFSHRAAGYPALQSYIQACEWLTVPEAVLDYTYAFIERLGQRYESYDESETQALSLVKVVYTTAPGQTPEGDVSDNSSFLPQTNQAWVHGDSPLFLRLEAALRDRLQVKLGLLEDKVHEVEMVGHLGSAARPIWVEVDYCLLPRESELCLCENEPTIQTPETADFDALPVAVSWKGQGYFNEGIWRFIIRTGAPGKLLIDGKPCCAPAGSPGGGAEMARESLSFLKAEKPRQAAAISCHAYLNGMHTIELILSSRTCAQPFQMLAYRIR